MGEHDRRGHELRGVIASETEHQSLIARTLFGPLFAFGPASINPLGNIVGLMSNDGIDEDFARVKNIVVVDVANFADGVADDLINRDGRFQVRIFRQIRNCYLAANDHEVTFSVGLASDPAALVARDTGVKHRVRDGVANFIGMTFADGFGGKDKTAEHQAKWKLSGAVPNQTAKAAGENET